MEKESKQKLMKYYYHRYKECERLGLKEEAERCRREYFRMKNWNELGFMELSKEK